MLCLSARLGEAPDIQVRTLDTPGAEHRQDMCPVVVRVMDNLGHDNRARDSPAIARRELAHRHERVLRELLPVRTQSLDPTRELLERRRPIRQWVWQPFPGPAPEVSLLCGDEVER